MFNTIGDNTNIPPHPLRNVENALNTSVPRKVTKFSGNVLYWGFQIALLILSLSFNILCNPVVWFLVKTLFNVFTEVFIYLVLGVCSLIISIITNLDDYYTRKRIQIKKNQENKEKSAECAREGVQIENCTVKKFVEKPKVYKEY